jgi:hypothetical protein
VKLPARIDSGASMASLDARELDIRDNHAVFRLPDRYGGLRLRLPIVAWRRVRSAEGRELRPVVKIDLCLGSRRMRALVNLNDRTGMTYALLIGRRILKNQFVVDVHRERALTPNCAEGS